VVGESSTSAIGQHRRAAAADNKQHLNAEMVRFERLICGRSLPLCFGPAWKDLYGKL